jgi:hypothetical protein
MDMDTKRFLGGWACIFGILTCASAWGAGREPAAALPEGVKLGTFSGWTKSVYLEARDPDVLAVVVPSVGGRVMHYGLHSQNVLFEMPGVGGKTLEKTKDLPWVGGFQCGVGTLDASSAASEVLSGVHTWTAPRELSVRVVSPVDSAAGLQIQKDLLMDPETGDLGIEQRAKNPGSKEVKGQFWSRTQCQSGGFVILPVRKTSRLPAGWGLRKPGSDQIDASVKDTDNILVRKGLLVVRALGASTQLVAESDAGWVGYLVGRTLFVQYFALDRNAKSLPNAGNVEVGFDLASVDIRIWGPEFVLAPGGEVVVPAKWTLEGFDKEATTPEQARTRVAKIPPSPFPR